MEKFVGQSDSFLRNDLRNWAKTKTKHCSSWMTHTCYIFSCFAKTVFVGDFALKKLFTATARHFLPRALELNNQEIFGEGNPISSLGWVGSAVHFVDSQVVLLE